MRRGERGRGLGAVRRGRRGQEGRRGGAVSRGEDKIIRGCEQGGGEEG